jgi:adenine/guanine phosphoribosyltransferase-like PRPP-binding protein
MGIRLAQDAPADVDVIVPVPDSGMTAALGYAEEIGKPFDLGIIRSHFVGRTFIQPTQAKRDLGVRRKHSANAAVLKGKRVLLIDDSIVRGTTSKKIVRMVREAQGELDDRVGGGGVSSRRERAAAADIEIVGMMHSTVTIDDTGLGVVAHPCRAQMVIPAICDTSEIGGRYRASPQPLGDLETRGVTLGQETPGLESCLVYRVGIHRRLPGAGLIRRRR